MTHLIATAFQQCLEPVSRTEFRRRLTLYIQILELAAENP